MQFVLGIIILSFFLPELAHAKRDPDLKLLQLSMRAFDIRQGEPEGALTSQRPTQRQEATIFRRFISPIFVGTDVQNVFIKSMLIDGNKLVTISEDKKAYSLDLKTQKVRKLKQIPSP